MPDARRPTRMPGPPGPGKLSRGVGAAEIPGLRAPLAGGGLDWPRYLAAVSRYKWLVAAVTVIGTVAGLVVSGQIATEYVAETTISVDTAGRDGGGGPIRASALLEPEAWTDGLVSYSVIEDVLSGLAASDTAGLAEALAQRFEADVDRDENLVRLRLRDETSERAAAILNAASRRFSDLALELEIENRQEVAGDLAERVRYASEQIAEAEAALEETRRNIESSPSERAAQQALSLQIGRDTAVENFYNRRVELEQVTRDREALEFLVDILPDSGLRVKPVEVIARANGAGELTSVLEDMYSKQAELRVLRNHYTDEHPRAAQLVDELAVLEGREAPRLTWVLFRMLRARESEMFRELTAASAELKATPRRVIEEGRLVRWLEVLEDYAAVLQRRHEEARAAVESSTADLRIVEPAVEPRWPVSRSRKIQLVLLAFLGCLAISAGGALILDRIDPRLHDAAQVGRELGISVLGTVPKLELRKRELHSQAVEQVMEAFRTIRANLAGEYGRDGSLLVAVSSFAPRDGKTLVVCNLALAFAHLERQTVIVDAAGRRSTLHERLNCRRGPGLTEYLAGEASWEEVIQPTSHAFVDLIAIGARSPAGLKPLPGFSMSELLSLLRTIYDVVLVEGLPLSYGRGAVALGRLAGNMLLVLRADATDLGVVEARLDLIEPMRIRVLGAVLNRVGASEHRA